MMKNPIDDALKGFSPTDVTVRVCDAIFGSVPFAPKLPTYASLDEATREVTAGELALPLSFDPRPSPAGHVAQSSSAE